MTNRWQDPGNRGERAHSTPRGLFEVCSAFTHVAACTLARSPIRDRYPKASDISSPPCLLRLLPAGANRRVGLAPTGKRRLVTAHVESRPSPEAIVDCAGGCRAPNPNPTPNTQGFESLRTSLAKHYTALALKYGQAVRVVPNPGNGRDDRARAEIDEPYCTARRGRRVEPRST
jgi:hypothetical protein